MPLTACVTIPHFALAFELAAHPLLRGLPVVIGGSPEEAKHVVDCSPEAEREGVRVGMPLRQVLAVCHQAVFLTARPALYQDRFTALVRALETISPIVEPESLGTCYVDLTGVLDLHGGLEATAAKLQQAADEALRAGSGLEALDYSQVATQLSQPSLESKVHSLRSPAADFSLDANLATEQQLKSIVYSLKSLSTAIAAGKFPARAAAALATPGEPLIIPEDQTAAFLAPLSIDLLPIPEEMRTCLLRLGLTTLGDLAALPVTAVQAQFGPAGRRAWALAGGAERERPRYEPPVESIAQALTFPAPATGVATLRVALEHLLAQGFAHPTRKGRGVRQVRILLRIEAGSRWERTVTLREPTIDHRQAARALFPLLEALALSGAVEEMAIVLQGFADESGRQEGLFAEKGKRLRQLAASLKQLTAQYQRPLLARVVEVEPWSRIPENRIALIDYDP